MSAAPHQLFHFDDYTVRPVGEHDRAYLETLIDADPYHQGRMTADFFLRSQPGEDAWALENIQGEVVLYFKTITAVRIAIQFRPTLTADDRRRNRRALLHGMQWLMGMFRLNRFREIITDTEGPELRAFAKRHLGFVDAPALSRMLHSMPQVPKMPPQSVETVSTNGVERVE